jgi:hypothetical protein
MNAHTCIEIISREREREIAAERARERDDIQKTCV